MRRYFYAKRRSKHASTFRFLASLYATRPTYLHGNMRTSFFHRSLQHKSNHNECSFEIAYVHLLLLHAHRMRMHKKLLRYMVKLPSSAAICTETPRGDCEKVVVDTGCYFTQYESPSKCTHVSRLSPLIIFSFFQLQFQTQPQLILTLRHLLLGLYSHHMHCFSFVDTMVLPPSVAALHALLLQVLVNPRRACARVTVVVLCVCLSVCLLPL